MAEKAKVTSKGYLLKEDLDWDWQDLRDFILDEMESRGISVDEPAAKVSGIIKSFFKRWDLKGIAIARNIFEIREGQWYNHPITITNFCENQDPYFAKPVFDQTQ